MSKILIVEDELSIQALLHDFIEEAGHSVVMVAVFMVAAFFFYHLYDNAD